jgi:hypothetical protein
VHGQSLLAEDALDALHGCVGQAEHQALLGLMDKRLTRAAAWPGTAPS